MTGKPVTTRHEKRHHTNHQFAVSYGFFLGRPLHILTAGHFMLSGSFASHAASRLLHYRSPPKYSSWNLLADGASVSTSQVPGLELPYITVTIDQPK